jgi:hypothetical protein
MNRISFRCSSCRARIRAVVQLIGQFRACPGCGQVLLIRPQVPEAAPPRLVLDDDPPLAPHSRR